MGLESFPTFTLAWVHLFFSKMSFFFFSGGGAGI
jgi:hypothetical protein